MSRRALWVIAAIAVLAAGVAGAIAFQVGRGSPTATSSPGPSATAPPTGRTPSPGPSPAPAGGPVKAPIRGLIDRQGPPPAAAVGLVQAYVVQVGWKDLQPAAFGPISADNAIDQALARVREPDYAAVGMVLKLRVYAGVQAPDWAKNLGGPPVPYQADTEGASVAGGSVGRFWTADFGRAYADLQAKLAAKYDSVPEIREVVVSRCTTLSAESFVRQPTVATNVQGLQAAGYTIDEDKQCIEQSLADHAVWQHTISDLSFNPFPNVGQDNRTADVGYTTRVMDDCRLVLGVRCGLANNSLSSDKLTAKNFQQMYAHMKQLGPVLTLQTAAEKRIGDWQQSLTAAVQMGANSVELPVGYAGWDRAALAALGRQLAANPVPAGL